jgi:hypothetical protein
MLVEPPKYSFGGFSYAGRAANGFMLAAFCFYR